LHLKKLSLYGFKSFAGRVDLDLAPGIVGIVGPNGVGKSNISDALRWAMGEQSARLLRGSKMQDVIFAGSQSRKGLGYAEVSLVFDNSDQFLSIGFDEVTVTRKVYRSGEAEYLLNGVPCRLRDIEDLFSGTGLGREAYSVVEQGKIDAILSARPDDRRSLFDEASGITKYRARKSQAQRRLLEVRADQLRVSDVAAELGRQLPLLEAQAEKALRWQELTERLTQLDVDVLSYELSRMSQRLDALRAEIQSLQDQEHALLARAAECEAALEEARVRMAQAESEVEALHARVSEARAAAERDAGRLNVAAQRHQALVERGSQLAAMVAERRERQIKLTDDYETACLNARQARAEYVERGSAARQTEERMAALTAARAAAEAEVEECKSALFDVLAHASDLRSRVRAGEDSMKYNRSRAVRIQAQLDEKDREYARLQHEVERIMREGRALIDQSVEADSRVSGARTALEAARAEQELAAERAARARADESSAQAAYVSLSALQRDYEGYGRAVRALLTSDEWRRAGLLGAVGELVSAPREYERAIEAALGPAVQNIIASTSGVAEKAISFLKESHAGRATFLPLDILRPSTVPSSQIPKTAPGVIGLASDLAESAPQHRKAVDYLLGRVLVVQDLRCGVALIRSGVRLRMVTLDGDQISAGGAMTGGEATDRQGGLLARGRRLEELQEQLERARLESAKAESDRARAHARVAQCQADLEEAERELAGLRLAVQGQNERLKLAQEALPRSADELASLELELKSVAAEDERTSAEVKEYTRQLEVVESDRIQLEAELESKSGALTQLKDEEAQSAADHSTLNADTAALRERVSALEVERSRAQAEVESCHAELERLNDQERAAAEEAALALQEVERLREAASSSAAAFENEQKQLEAARARRADELVLVNEAERASRSARRGTSAADSRLSDARVGEARLDAERAAIAERLFASYSVGAEEALSRDVSALSLSPEEARLEIKRLRQEIDDLGPVNHTSIEESKELAERHHFLKEQLADMESAQESLSEVIRECDRVCIKQFTETFEAIRGEFSDIFQDVFGGGAADLALDDPSAPLECGVEIVCQPPGKRLTSLSLLSGGEKALAAIALLFAIMRVKPSPVCVLDEIGSALDEANVARFVELLEGISRKVQVIIVTHRKRTMECADTLFGVTMEESGVSKVFSIRATDYKL
jgi:chromosome segregation protein